MFAANVYKFVEPANEDNIIVESIVSVVDNRNIT